MDQAAVVNTQAAGDTAQQIYLGGVLEAKWWGRLQSPELDRTVNVISALIPPVIIVVIAVIVGFVVYSILSAVFEMTHSLQFRPH